jgi:serine/threonine protein kinase
MQEQDLVGVTLGNSTLERIIGKGGMAIVFLAQQARPTRTVAVKVLLPTNMDNDPEQQRIFLERFRREADTAAKLEHKNILPIYEYAEASIRGQRLAYLVMPYIRGGTLRQRIDELHRDGKMFDLQTVSDSVEQIADALSYAHSLGIVHRDIKPGNLLFHSDGRLVLADFGIVRLNTMPALTIAGSFIGTAEYAAPEQVSGGDVDSRSDIYALGIILYELLTGRVPFTGSTPFEVMGKQLHDPVPSLRISRPDLSPAIEFVVKKALAKDPKDRYQQVGELAADFHAAVTPALVKPAGFSVGGDANNNDLTVADKSWQPPVPARALGTTVPVPVLRTANAAASQPTPRGVLAPVQTPQSAPVKRVTAALSAPAGDAVQIQLPTAPPDLDTNDQVKVYRPNRRITVYILGLATLLLQVVVLSLTIRENQNGTDTSGIVLGVLLGNGLNLLSLAAIGFTGLVRQRNIRGIFNQVLWTAIAALVLSGFFISYGEPSQNSLNLPWISYCILLLTNIFSIRSLSKVDVDREQIEVAPIYWKSALIGALTGLLPLTLILIFALLAPLFWTTNSSLFLRLLGVLIVTFIGAPTPGSMMAVWLSHRVSFPILARTSALAGLFMCLVAYFLVIIASWLINRQTLFTGNFDLQLLVPGMIIMGALLGLVGLLRGMLDAWVYHRIIMRRP